MKQRFHLHTNVSNSATKWIVTITIFFSTDNNGLFFSQSHLQNHQLRNYFFNVKPLLFLSELYYFLVFIRKQCIFISYHYFFSTFNVIFCYINVYLYWLKATVKGN